MKKRKIALICVVAITPLLLIAAFLLLVLPYINAASSMPEGATLSLTDLGDGDFELSWPSGENAGSYRVRVLDSAGERVFEAVSDTTECTLEGLDEKSVTIEIIPVGHFSLLGGEHEREGEPFSLALNLKSPGAPTVEWTVDEDADTLLAQPERMAGLEYLLYEVSDLGRRQLADTASGKLLAAFGEDEILGLPEYGSQYSFIVCAVVSGEGYTITGLPSETYLLEREDLLGDTGELTIESAGDNSYILSWTEAKGDYYEIQARTGAGDWQTLAQVDCDAELTYYTGTLKSCREYTFRIAGYDEGVEESVSSSDEQSFTTERSSKYCTIWPLTELAVYSDAQMNEQLEYTVPAAAAYCVLEEANGMFRVRVSDGVYGWIDSNFCLINLSEYLGELLSYDITNSYASKYLVHGYVIPEVSDTVITGYEYIKLAEDVYLVPYLYPCCEKLYEAANAALADGYRLKIYDSYRPQMATRYIYDTTELIIDDPLPEEDFYGEVPDDLPEEENLTYRRLVTEGSYSLPNFLARSGSMHNMGIALDLTLENAETGEELEMETDMHDLSVYSVISRNNENANLLDKYMKNAGFGGLTSEWWHFQDNETREALALNIYMYYGVSCAGWTADDNGWRYRNADGSYIQGRSAEIGGVTYEFDSDGYCLQEER